MGQTEGRGHGKSIKLETGMDSVTSEPGETHNNRVLVETSDV